MSTLLLLASCTPEPTEEEIVQPDDEQNDEEVFIAPTHQITKADYKMILPFSPSEARGVIDRQIANRVDIDEMETGLRRQSTEVFDPEEHYYQDGQYLSRRTVESWIDDLNPDRPEPGSSAEEFRNNPRYLSHILEQNYLKKNEDETMELAGVSIGIALKTVYRFQTDVGEVDQFEPIPYSEMLKQGKEIAQKVLERIREIDELQEVPILIALFQEEEQASPVPGNYIHKTVIPSYDMMVDEWEEVKEENVLFPSSQAEHNYFEDYEIVKKFGSEISQYFPNYVGYIGRGFYVNETLQKLTIEIPLDFYGSAEVTGFTQYVYGIAKAMFSENYNLEIRIESSEQLESIIYRKAGEEDLTVHLLQ